jgi:membrane associated rhomboid family serine protease
VCPGGTWLDLIDNVTTLLALVALGVLVYAGMPPEMRRRAVQMAIDAAHGLVARAGERPDAFRAALRERTARPFATITIAALHVAVFAAMVFGKGALADPATLVAWGANVGTRTTNGEWWRLAASPFVHAGFGSMLIEVAAIVQIGWTLERLVGPIAFAAAYATAAIAAGLAALAIAPLAVTSGSAGAITALYVILFAIAIRSARRQNGLAIPHAAMTRFAPLAAIFFLYAVGLAAPAFRAALVAVVATILFVVASVGDVSDGLPQPRRVAIGFAVALVASAAVAIEMRGVADVRPELQRLVEVERQTSTAYDAAIGKFRNAGAANTAALTKTIDESIVPQLVAADNRIKKISGVPREDRQMVDDAREYIRMRIESWHLRSQGLLESAQISTVDVQDAAAYRDRVSTRHRKASVTLGRAESAQRAALEILNRVSAASSRQSTAVS